MCRNDSGIGGACLGPDWCRAGRSLRAKALLFWGSYGTTKVVPFQNIDSRSVIQKAVRSCSFKTGMETALLSVWQWNIVARMASVSMERQEPSSLKILSSAAGRRRTGR